MYDIREPSLDAAIDLSIMATKILYLPLENIERIIRLVQPDLDRVNEIRRTNPFPLLDQYLALMQDHSAPEDTKVAAFLYLTRSSREPAIKKEGESHEAGTGEGTIIVERALAGQTSD